jgi:hypothetical protein
MTRVEKCTKRTNYVYGEKPQFTDEEYVLMREWNRWIDWSPDMKLFTNDSYLPIPLPQPPKPEVTPEFVQKIINYKQWVRGFNSYYDNL